MYDATFRIPGHTMVEHRLEAPLDRFGAFDRLTAGGTASQPAPAAPGAAGSEAPGAPQEGTGRKETAAAPTRIEIFAREYVREGREDRPRLVYFQGGPGFPAPRMAPIGSWLSTALDHYRVVLLDERGTGSSHPLDAQAVTDVGGPGA